MTRDIRTSRLPLALVAAPILFNLVTLREEATGAHNFNDASMHLSMV